MNAPLDRLRAALAGRYDIEREIGAGGMASVYLAHDRKHGRQVAIKVLRSEIAELVGAERFLREIEIAAQLNHPHVLPLHDSGEVAGRLFYVMPYVAGESLRSHLRRHPQLPIEEAVRIAGEIAEALEYAHQQGIVHRDIKPENVLLAHGHAVVADFGIARALSEAGGSPMTESGIALGTPAYMSPEQGTAQSVDRRTDVYSLGCVVYEMLAGEPPFTGPTAQAIIARKVAHAVPSLRVVRDAVPPRLERAIMRALAKSPADRFATAAEFKAALLSAVGAPPATAAPTARWRVAAAGGAVAIVAVVAWLVTSTTTQAAAPSHVAVLPCDNIGGAGAANVGDRFTEEIIVKLSKLAELRVKSWLAVQRYRGTAKAPHEIADELRVGAVVRCAVEETSGEVRASVQLIDAATGDVAWTDEYQRPLTAGQIYDIQRDVAAEIAGRLGASLSAEERVALDRAPTQDLAALNLYRLGRHFWDMRTAEGLVRATEYYQQAIARDSAFADPYVGLAEARGFIGQLAAQSPREFMPEVKRLVLRALEIHERHAEAHSGLGQVSLLYDWDWPAANQEFRRAIALEPSSSRAHVWYAQSLSYVGRHREAIAESERAVDLDPTLPFVRHNLAFRLYYAREGRRALQAARAALELDPDNWAGHMALGTAFSIGGRLDSAIAAFRRSVDLSGRSLVPLARLGHALGRSGQRAAARAILDTLEARSQRAYVPSTYRAMVHAGLGELDETVTWLERAYDERDFNLIWNLGEDPAFDDLRDHPGYRSLRRRVGFDEWSGDGRD